MQTRHHVHANGCDFLVLGTIQGFVPDGQAVAHALAEHDPGAVALGVPPEDIEGLEALASDADVELPDLDPQSQRLLELLEPLGGTRIPSPDLEAAHRWSTENQRPLVPVDLDDETHADLYVRHVKLRHVIRSGSVNKRLLTARFPEQDPAALVVAWDAVENAVKPLRAIEAERERHMAKGIRALAKEHARVVAVVPVARCAGVVRSLRDG